MTVLMTERLTQQKGGGEGRRGEAKKLSRGLVIQVLQRADVSWKVAATAPIHSRGTTALRGRIREATKRSRGVEE